MSTPLVSLVAADSLPPLPNHPPPINGHTSSNSNGSGSVNGTSTSSTPPDPDLHYSVLVHNVTHSDLLLGLAPNDLDTIKTIPIKTPPASSASPFSFASQYPSSLIAQPRFHRYRDLTRAVLKHFTHQQQHKLPVYFPSLHYNQAADPPASTPPSPAAITQPTDSTPAVASSPPVTGTAPPPCSLPYGFQLSSPLPAFDSWDGLRLRSSFTSPGCAPLPDVARVLAVFFPMLAVLIPKWMQACEKRRLKRDKIREVMQSTANTAASSTSTSSNSRQSPSSLAASTFSSSSSHHMILYLVSGAGTPWDRSLSTAANSTKCTAQLLQLYLSYFYPAISVHVVHSSADIFHYDSNVRFINTQLMPLLLSHRSYLSSLFADQWPAHLSLFSSLTDSPPARSSSLLSSLRPLRPSTLHMWQLKSFWCEYPAVTGRGEEDVEEVTFDKVEMTPPQRVSEVREEDVRLLVNRLRCFRDEFMAARDGDSSNEMSAFWMRKSKKPVLSMLMVHKPGHSRRYYRGLNMEVSMPTGSLCSERSAIASALSDDVGLCRRDLKMIAVLALPLEKKKRRNVEEEEAERRMEEQMVDEIKLLETSSPLISQPANIAQSPLSPLTLHRGTLSNDDMDHDDDDDEDEKEDGGAEDEAGGEATHRAKKRRLLLTDLTISTAPHTHSPHRSSSSSSLTSLLTSPTLPLTHLSSASSAALDASPSFLPSPTAIRTTIRKQHQLEAELLLMHIRRAQHTGDDEGRNPINPCGACNEWLKKIAEFNPDFKVVTFTSTDCNTVFVKGVKD